MNRYKLIGIEPISENEIANYTFDGVEIQEKPLNPNEEFIQFTNKIDFKKLHGKTLDYTSQSFYCNDEESEQTVTHQANVTEKLRKHITCSIEEINALIDMLQITSSKNMGYMELKKLQKESSKETNKDSHDENLPNYIAGKKMALCATASTLLNGAARLSKSLSTVKDQHHQNTFYSDLANLRQEWRIKWFQTHLVGDLGLSSCGSVFPEQGGFQIMEQDDKDLVDFNDRDLDLQSLKVVLMHNQEGEPIMRINVKDNANDAMNDRDEVKSYMDLPPAKDLKYQTDRLNRGQNLLFLSEIFNTLCWESRLLNSPVLIKENRLSINLKGRHYLDVDFFILPERHWFGYQDIVGGEAGEEVMSTRRRHEESLHNTSLFSDALILLLRELLREKHRCNLSAHFSLSQPVAGPVQVPLDRRFHGVQWYRPLDHSSVEQNQLIFLLPVLIDAVIMQRAKSQILAMLDMIADEAPHSISVRSHINPFQSMLHCSMSLTISATTYSTIAKHYTLQLSVSRTLIHVTIISDQIRHQLIYDDIDDITVLKSFFQSQIWNFKLEVIKQLAVVKHHWQLVEMRLTDCQKTVQQDVNACIIVLSTNGKSLLNIVGNKDAKKYQLSVSHTRITDGQLGEVMKINLPQLERRLIKPDIEVINVLFTALT